jgi:hypothetical protein
MADTRDTAVDASARVASAETVTPIETPAIISKEEATPTPAESKETAIQTTSQDKLPTDAWPALDVGHPLSQFLEQLAEILKEADYNEVYGITLVPAGSFQTKLILQKFLRANANDLPKSRAQLLGTLKWRKEYQPLKLVDTVHSEKKFGGLGYITKIADVPGSENKVDVVTFNIYGAVKDNKETFGDLDAFMRWRVALMESSVHKLGLAEATVPIPDLGEGVDPYQGFQVHDYMNVSFLRQDPLVKAASKQAIGVFGAYYRELYTRTRIMFVILIMFTAETMSRKFFVSVPLIMSWMFTAVKTFISKETQKKFTVMSYATYLAGELGPGVPEVYGGKAEPLEKIGETVKTE